MDEEDNGQLLDKDLRHQQQDEDTQLQRQRHHHRPPHTNNDNTNIIPTLPEDEEEDHEQMRMMVRYWRSKSLPFAYLPQFGGAIPNQASIDSGSGCSSVFESVSGGGDKRHHQQQHNFQNSNRKTYNDGCARTNRNEGHNHVSCISRAGESYGGYHQHFRGDNGNSNTSDGSNIQDQIKNGQVKNLRCGGGSSGPSGEQESGEVKRRTEGHVKSLSLHYYTEGGWGWVITFCALFSHALTFGTQIYLSNVVFHRFHTGWLGSVSMGVSLFLSPLWVSICKRKSTRLSAVFGGLTGSLGILFTSFASQFHQICISYAAFVGVGVGLTRDASSLMVGQYFKRRRDLVEMFVVSGSGVGLALMSVSIHSAISSFGWRLGLQLVTILQFITFFLGTCFRSASLYHPQRRAILHLKNQKRKVKEKEKREEKPPFIDTKCLKSKTLQILLLSSAFTSFGINTPLFHMALEVAAEGEDQSSLVLLNVYMGVAWVVGCCLFGLLVIQKNQECRVSKQYLCQVASVICGISIFAFPAIEGLGGLVIFSWVYGFSMGGYNYALKVYTYERVRARHFPRAWSFVQASQSITLIIGVPLTGHMNTVIGWKSGYYLSAFAVFVGSAFLFLTDVRRRRLSRRKTPNSSMKTNETTESVQSPKMRRLSFSYPMEQFPTQSKHDSDGQAGGLDPGMLAKELTCISEEGLVDMDFQDIYFDEWAEYFGECITSCNKVENCLASEYDPDYAVMVERRARRWSAARPSFAQNAHAGIGTTAAALAGGIAGFHNTSNLLIPPHHPHLIPVTSSNDSNSPNLINSSNHSNNESSNNHQSSLREIPVFRNHGRNNRNGPPLRSITVIDEASV